MEILWNLSWKVEKCWLFCYYLEDLPNMSDHSLWPIYFMRCYKKGQWALHVYSIATFITSWLQWQFLPYNVQYLGHFCTPLPTLKSDIIYGRSLIAKRFELVSNINLLLITHCSWSAGKGMQSTQSAATPRKLTLFFGQFLTKTATVQGCRSTTHHARAAPW